MFFFPSSFLSSLESSDTQVFEALIRARRGLAAHFCEAGSVSARPHARVSEDLKNALCRLGCDPSDLQRAHTGQEDVEV